MEKINPNKVYVINKTNYVSHAKILIGVYYTHKKANFNEFMNYLSWGLATGRCIVLVSFDKETKLIACAILFKKNTPFSGKVLWIEWVWIDNHNPKIGKDYMNTIMDIAKRLKIEKIAGATIRNTEAIYKKYKFKAVYTVVEKKVN